MTTRSNDATCAPPRIDDDFDPNIPPEELPTNDAFARAFLEVKPTADAVPEARLRAMNVHAELAYVNAKAGVAAIEPHMAFIRSIPGVDVDAIERIPLLALSLLGASHRLNLLAPPENALPERLARGRKLRKGLLHIARGAAALGLVPEAPVKRIAKGSGSLDTARDLVELAMLLREAEPSCRGKLVIAPQYLNEAAEVGSWLRDAIQPTNARPKPTDAELREATLDRARIWTLLSESYDELQRVAAFLRIDVPSLQSRRGMKKKAKPET